MRKLLATAMLVLSGGMAANTVDPPRAAVLLELFTSEGCSSCPPADRLLQTLDRTQPVAGADLIVLSEHVDYWDQLGWKDPFSSAEFTERQQRYSNVFHIDSIYTPQLVIDGRKEVVGNDAVAARAAIEDVVKSPKSQLTLSAPTREGDHLTMQVDLPAGERQGVLYVVLAENKMQTQVLRGENSGRSLSHVGVVRKLIKVGNVKKGESFSQAVQVPVGAGVGAQGLRLVAFLQDARTARVLAVAQQKL